MTTKTSPEFTDAPFVTFIDKRTLNKYKITFDKIFNEKFIVTQVDGNFVILNNGIKVNKLLLTKDNIKNYALRLELDEFGETILMNTIPSRALTHVKEGVETTGEKMDSLNNHI